MLIIVLLVKVLLILIIPFLLKKLSRVTKQLDLTLLIESGLLITREFFSKDW